MEFERLYGAHEGQSIPLMCTKLMMEAVILHEMVHWAYVGCTTAPNRRRWARGLKCKLTGTGLPTVSHFVANKPSKNRTRNLTR